jgi:Heterokaryon incompatibility protein (HET)
LPQEKRYAALSYVWGPATSPHLRWTDETTARMFTPGGLHATCSGDIPTKIRDAVTLCSVLDLHYLWVDAVCIQQDDT